MENKEQLNPEAENNQHLSGEIQKDSAEESAQSTNPSHESQNESQPDEAETAETSQQAESLQDNQPALAQEDTQEEEQSQEISSSAEVTDEPLPDTESSDELDHDDEDEESEDHQDYEKEPQEGASREDLGSVYGSMSKEELVAAIEELVKNEDVDHIRSNIGFIKASFRKLIKEENLANYEKNLSKEDGHEEEEQEAAPVDELSDRFDAAFAVYKEKKASHDQTQEKQKLENLAAKEAILEELRQLIESEEELKKTYDQFNELQEKWRQVGQVPQSNKNNLWNNYHFLVEKFFDKVKINKELKDLDLKRNLEAKTELCEKAEELLLEPSITKSFQKLQKLHEAWKEIGPVPNDKKDEIWDRFKAATDKLNKRRQEHYDLLRDEQNQNYTAKLMLCEKAEELAAHTPDTPRKWQDLTNQMNGLFTTWKTIGFAPKKVNNLVWNRFRSTMDNFFKNKKEFFNKYKDQQTENYNQKLNLCMQAEILKESEDWKATTEELISLQKQWKKIGPVPSKYSDKIWKRFRAACDEFFEKKAHYFSNIGEKQDDNLKQKLELIEKIRSYPYNDNNSENLEVLKGFQRQWMEIGHVPIKQKDKIQAEFRKTIDQQFDKLRLNKKVKNTLSFHSKIENLKNSPNAENIIYKERNFLLNKITGLQNDIKLWENNIGFFASSKKADVLKAEFEEKIENAKQEIAVMKEKLKILRDA
jgi:hypothetical protein